MNCSDLIDLLHRGDVLFLTGAGLSIAAGIPAYRTREGEWARSTPITDSQFRQSTAMRARYWARSYLGWPMTARAKPALAHKILAQWHLRGLAPELITQNVDRLHQKAGFDAAIDIHGRLDRVVCLDCGSKTHRDHWQLRLTQLNPQLIEVSATLLPDGDTELPDAVVATVQVPACSSCGGVVMPDVVFFGGTIPGHVSARTLSLVDRCKALMVLGSSLQVYSGYRLCRRAVAAGAQLIIVNPGPTRADELATWRVTEDAHAFLKRIDAELVPRMA